MLRVDRRIDVTTAVGSGEELHTAALVVVPEASRLPRRPVVYFAYPGGGYNRRYYDLQPDGHPGYSQAEFHAGEGDIFVCCDHLAVGDSDVPTAPIDFEAVGRANAETARTVARLLAAGDLHPDLALVEPPSSAWASPWVVFFSPSARPMTRSSTELRCSAGAAFTSSSRGQQAWTERPC
jgi:hypothetical protein